MRFHIPQITVALAVVGGVLVEAAVARHSLGMLSTRGQPDQTLVFDYNGQKVRGVNLGGWLVLEPWITPSLFEPFDIQATGVVDEYTLSRHLGYEETVRYLTPHWESWITFTDLQQIKDWGLNHLRIPIGYWAVAPLNGDPYVQGQLRYLDRAVQWSKQLGLKVWVDLHGAPGSQNGFDNSGQRDRLEWQSVPGFVEHTLVVIDQLAKRYATPELSDTIVGIELLNEPLGQRLDMDRLKTFWQDGYRTTRQTHRDVTVVIGDAFQPPQSWNGFMMPPDFNHVLLDTHHYNMFYPGLVEMSEQQHTDRVCAFGNEVRGTDKWTVVGEWSGAFTDCAKWVNGYGNGSRYQGEFGGGKWVGECGRKTSGRVEDLSPAEKDRIRRFIEAQLDAYEQKTGWIFWTWRTEGAPEWDMKNLLEQGVFPKPDNPTDRKWPGQCGY